MVRVRERLDERAEEKALRLRSGKIPGVNSDEGRFPWFLGSIFRISKADVWNAGRVGRRSSSPSMLSTSVSLQLSLPRASHPIVLVPSSRFQVYTNILNVPVNTYRLPQAQRILDPFLPRGLNIVAPLPLILRWVLSTSAP